MRLNQQLDYLIAHGAARAAAAVKLRVEDYLSTTLGTFPRMGLYLAEEQVWEAWVPRTRLVVWYVFDDIELHVVTVWHAAQKRPTP